MQINKNYEPEKQFEKDSILKYFDPNKIILYYVLQNQIRLMREQLDQPHPADEEIFREVKEKDKELGLLEQKLRMHSPEELLEDARRQKDYYMMDRDNRTIPPMFYNYILPSAAKKKIGIDYFIISPGNITLVRATQGELGEGVLGVAFPGLGIIKVLDSLYGTDFDEVFRHEVNHILYPSMPERDVRNMTRQQCCYDCRYN